jgi:multiple sugar transport system ATP-binding protein
VQTRFEIARLHRDFGRASAIYVTHDQVEAMTLADRIVLLNTGAAVARDGSVAQCGTPLELYHQPRNRFVAAFIGSPRMNFAPARLLQYDHELATLQLRSGERVQARVDARGQAPGAELSLGIRPEDVEVGAGEPALARDVLWQERLGEATYLYLDAAGCGDPWVAKAPGHFSAAPGHRVSLRLPPERVHVFDGADNALPRTVQPEGLPALAAAA